MIWFEFSMTQCAFSMTHCPLFIMRFSYLEATVKGVTKNNCSKNFRKIHRETPVIKSFLQYYCRPVPATYLKKTPLQMVSVDFMELLKIATATFSLRKQSFPYVLISKGLVAMVLSRSKKNGAGSVSFQILLLVTIM